MSTNMDLLRGKIKECGFTQSDVAKKINMDESTFSRKICADGLKFTIGEMHQMANVLGLTKTDCKNIFLP